MKETQVINKNEMVGLGLMSWDDPDVVLIDRKTKWGNPYKMKSEKDRDGVILKYREYMVRQIDLGIITLEELAGLHGKYLVCHCKPKPCHGDVLKELSLWAVKKLSRKLIR